MDGRTDGRTDGCIHVYVRPNEYLKSAVDTSEEDSCMTFVIPPIVDAVVESRYGRKWSNATVRQNLQ